jgi:hypothetical protein
MRGGRGEHIGQVANSLYAKWRILIGRVEGRLPGSWQRGHGVHPPKESRSPVVVAEVLQVLSLALSTREGGGATGRSSAAPGRGAYVVQSGQRHAIVVT